ncbi:MAG: DUF2892 domain-containing protein [Pseudomonas sp.]|uniref:YgaP family membrane protein n=1 Tax=Pseudomonas sp. TaxID=306 RepID=UPI00339203D8
MPTLSGPVRLVPTTRRVDLSTHNVEGWERALSVAGGVLMLAKGLRRGGVPGLFQVAVAGVALTRGISGYCAGKNLLMERRAQLDDIRLQLEAARIKLAELQSAALVSDA